MGSMTHKEIKTLIGSSGITQEKLKKLLQSNDLQDFDPVAEAFKLVDPEGTGHVDMNTLKGFLAQTPGIGEVDGSDLEFLLRYMDTDNDGKIGLEDFAAIGGYP